MLQPGLAQDVATLPDDARVVWDLSRAARDRTATRERICINGLWRWQPAADAPDRVPRAGWGYFKVPGCWPGISNYMQKDSQIVHLHPDWKDVQLGQVRAAWYQREIQLPSSWSRRRVSLSVEYLNSLAGVYVDGEWIADLRFPGGEVDLSEVCRPGRKHLLSLHVAALPLKGVMLSYNDTGAAREVPGQVARRGLCGDVFLLCSPAGPHLTDVQLRTSVRRWEIDLDVALQGLVAQEPYTLQARVEDGGRLVTELPGHTFTTEDLTRGRLRYTAPWHPERLWDTHTPGHQYELHLALHDADGTLLDAFHPVRLGFRELWIEGRDFYLNGSRIFLSAVPLDNAQVGAAAATYEAARESLERLQSFGVNLVYTHNYDCAPGSHLSFAEILRAADDVGMLVALSQPHFSHYDWQAEDSDRNNGYARHAAFYVRVAQGHPSVVMYAMSHNATGYSEDMNPDLIDGVHDARSPWSQRNVACARRAEAIVRRLDPGRIVYHHSSGNLGSMHTSNFYPNFVPTQELCDWFEHWATDGEKPVFLCEYGAPLSWDWTMYRGWYEGKRAFGSANVPWEFCLAEWNAQLLGDAAFQISDMERANLRWEAERFRAGAVWHRWDYPHHVGSRDFAERDAIFALYIQETWRAFRGWGLSANSPWTHSILWRQRDGIEKRRVARQVDWRKLQRPGFSPDHVDERYERFDLAFERSDWIPTTGAQALIRNNGPVLAYLAGAPGAFTSKGHNVLAGETIEKQIIVINNSRRPVSCECAWESALAPAAKGTLQIELDTGTQARLPLVLQVPGTTAPGEYAVTLRARFDTGEVQHDELALHVLEPRRPPAVTKPVALFDPVGDTRRLLEELEVPFQTVGSDTDLSAVEVLVIGKGALTPDGAAPDLGRVREGLKVLVFEQTGEVLEQRLGFRVARYGLRRVFLRLPDHPVLEGLTLQHLRDWRGSATILPPRLAYRSSERYSGAPAVTWCSLEVPRVWRCGCRGNVASVLIEKPARGDFLPLLDGGFSLQYSPLLEYREGQGLVLFCQMDVSGRTEVDPAARQLARNLLEHVCRWQATPRRGVLYVGEPAGQAHLAGMGLECGTYDGGKLPADHVLVVGPGGDLRLAMHGRQVTAFLRAGGHALALGWSHEQPRPRLPLRATTRMAEHIASSFEPPARDSPLAGVGPADVHDRSARTIPLISEGARITGDGVLACDRSGRVVYCQLVPWHLDHEKNPGLRRTFRRASFLVARLLANLGSSGQTPLLARFAAPVQEDERRWLQGLYLDEPREWDDPYRFFRW